MPSLVQRSYGYPGLAIKPVPTDAEIDKRAKTNAESLFDGYSRDTTRARIHVITTIGNASTPLRGKGWNSSIAGCNSVDALVTAVTPDKDDPDRDATLSRILRVDDLPPATKARAICRALVAEKLIKAAVEHMIKSGDLRYECGRWVLHHKLVGAYADKRLGNRPTRGTRS